MDSRVKHDVMQDDAAEQWRQLSRGDQGEELAWAWLSLQCQQIPGAQAGLLLEADAEQDDALTPRALWPQDGQDVAPLAEVIDQAQQSASGVLLELASGRYGLAYPLQADGRIIAVAGVELHADTEAQLQRAMQQLQWGMAWLEAGYYRHRCAAQEKILEALHKAQAVLGATLAEDDLDTACRAFCGELAAQWACDRVSVGFLQQGHVRVQALSHSVEPGRKMNLVRYIAGAMEEAIDQGEALILPPLTQAAAQALLAQEKLSREAGNGSVMSLPLPRGDACLGAVTLERPADMPFSADELTSCQSLCVLVAGILRDKQLNQQGLWQRVTTRSHQFLVSLFGAGHLKRKLTLIGLILVALTLSLVDTERRVAADAVLRGEVQRAIVAPFAGYLESSEIRPGDRVKKGDEFARLDDHELRLERVKWASQREQFQRQYEEAMATRNRAQARILLAQIAQADARLALTESRLQRTHISAPFDGIVVSGELSQRLGASVQEGEVLFELAPLDAYRVVLLVDEQDIALVQEKQQGKLIASALPGVQFPLTITRITPISVPGEGRNRFQVEARLAVTDPRLRPGMEGVGKIDTGEGPLITVWTRGLRHWLSLQWWAWFG